MQLGDINVLAVLVATVAHQALGALWYGGVFRETWLRAMGKTREELEAESANMGMGPSMAIGGFCSLISVTALAFILSAFDDPSLADGIVVGLVSGIGFVAASTFMNGIYEQKKPTLSVLFGAYYTIGLAIAGAILGAWR